ncbi:T-complex protein 1 subunit delta [Gossypium australe]|uniref:T-complex protein 1 subunit delta n=1 Tax=Gossypium australe TaxID=47621 RepID=A0A5B6U8W6_9ROSI|nr:T-complex protein 1 subunit delta [Gossypium australe]
MTAAVASNNPNLGNGFKEKDKPESVRTSNIVAAKAVSDSFRPTRNGQMIQAANGEVTVTNDGATILNQMSVVHPTAKMLVELSKAQDIEAGDGTTTVVILAGSLLDAAEKLLAKGIHPTTISDSFRRAATFSEKILDEMSTPVDINNDEELIKLAATSLNSKVFVILSAFVGYPKPVVSQHSQILAPMAVQAVKKIMTNIDDQNVNLRMIKIVKKLGETVDVSQLIDGALIEQNSMGHGGPSRVEKAKIGLIQFQISPPKTMFMENQVVISDYTQMDRALKEERNYILELCKQIKKTGCNVLLIQKSILRDAVNELALHFFAKLKIMVIKDIEREDIEFYSKIIGCRPVASVDHFTPETLGTADLVEEIETADGKVVKWKCCFNLIRGSSKLVLEEAERSLHDALCVIRCLVKKRALLPGGGAPEMQVSAFAEALELIPYTLAEMLDFLQLGRLQNCGAVTNILEENVLQPLLVTSFAIKQAAECVRAILKIDDVVLAVR